MFDFRRSGAVGRRQKGSISSVRWLHELVCTFWYEQNPWLGSKWCTFNVWKEKRPLSCVKLKLCCLFDRHNSHIWIHPRGLPREQVSTLLATNVINLSFIMFECLRWFSNVKCYVHFRVSACHHLTGMQVKSSLQAFWWFHQCSSIVRVCITVCTSHVKACVWDIHEHIHYMLSYIRFIDIYECCKTVS